MHYCSPNLRTSEFADYGIGSRTRHRAVAALNGSADLPYVKLDLKGSFENSDGLVFSMDSWFHLNRGATPRIMQRGAICDISARQKPPMTPETPVEKRQILPPMATGKLVGAPVDTMVIRKVETRLQWLPFLIGAIGALQVLWLFGTTTFLGHGSPDWAMLFLASLLLSASVTAGFFTKWLLADVSCALTCAGTSARQIKSMTEQVRLLAAQGDITKVGRLPMLQPDEIGELAESVNGMLARLEQVERERSAAVRARKNVEEELQKAQKLGSVGRLAAGIAHEINTPLQFVNDNTHFLQRGIRDLTTMIAHYRTALEVIAAGRSPREALAEIGEQEEDTDLNYLLKNLPKALADSVEGLTRVATIARSMKEFSHPDQKEKAPTDLNQAVRTTLTIARNEYKYVADLETNFGDLPLVNCLAGEINQVILNIVVNASHAIEDVTRGTGKRGRITVHTFEADGFAVITISDTGGGIQDSVREHMFEPFFTTKSVGKGTGQGLAISRSVVVDKHGGQLTFETQVGIGTTFAIRLPLERDGMTTDNHENCAQHVAISS